MFRATGAGGRCAPLTSSVYPHHPISTRIINVVSCMIQSAFSLDSVIPLIFSHQKYRVATMANISATVLLPKTMWRCPNASISFSNPARY
jgi:hypothetical protein